MKGCRRIRGTHRSTLLCQLRTVRPSADRGDLGVSGERARGAPAAEAREGPPRDAPRRAADELEASDGLADARMRHAATHARESADGARIAADEARALAHERTAATGARLPGCSSPHRRPSSASARAREGSAQAAWRSESQREPAQLDGHRPVVLQLEPKREPADLSSREPARATNAGSGARERASYCARDGGACGGAHHDHDDEARSMPDSPLGARAGARGALPRACGCGWAPSASPPRSDRAARAATAVDFAPSPPLHAVAAGYSLPPPRIVCHLCGRPHGLASARAHALACARRRAATQQALPAALRTAAISPPREALSYALATRALDASPGAPRTCASSTRRGEDRKLLVQYNAHARAAYESSLPRCCLCDAPFEPVPAEAAARGGAGGRLARACTRCADVHRARRARAARGAAAVKWTIAHLTHEACDEARDERAIGQAPSLERAAATERVAAARAERASTAGHTRRAGPSEAAIDAWQRRLSVDDAVSPRLARSAQPQRDWRCSAHSVRLTERGGARPPSDADVSTAAPHKGGALARQHLADALRAHGEGVDSRAREAAIRAADDVRRAVLLAEKPSAERAEREMLAAARRAVAAGQLNAAPHHLSPKRAAASAAATAAGAAADAFARTPSEEGRRSPALAARRAGILAVNARLAGADATMPLSAHSAREMRAELGLDLPVHLQALKLRYDVLCAQLDAE
ncbi:hypothetical protein KFE25_000696 [Diacronema lutheri]|uniref:Uncharacterized protein n=1 Tax=Diacronema lutheri TaxID=2081491 RepID=A0A8J5XXS3_DIALT|nr:hypothetical protein KFE25_000696 [Diacronema lutheri]